MNLNHLALRVSDPKKSLEFYERLGFKKVKEARLEKFKTTLIFLQAENGFQLELVHNWNENKPPEPNNGFLHIGIAVQDIEKFLERLSELGIKPAKPIFQTPDGMKICFLQDPDRYQIELVEQMQK